MKSIQNSNSGSPAKSPAGVNRRNAVLFTRKKQKEETKPPNEVTDDKPETEVVGNKTDKKKKPIAAVQALQDDVLENQETELQGTRVCFEKKIFSAISFRLKHQFCILIYFVLIRDHRAHYVRFSRFY